MSTMGFPEGTTPRNSDSKERSLKKINAQLAELFGDVESGDLGFPEGTEPRNTDRPERSLQKINAILHSQTI